MKERPAKAHAEANKTMLSMRMDVKLMGELKEEAARLGIPYTTLIQSVLHRYLTGELVDKKTRAG